MKVGLGRSSGTATTTAYDALVDHVPDAAIVFAPDERILVANDRAAALYGRSVDELRRLGARDLLGPGAGPEILTTDTGICPVPTIHRRADFSVFTAEVCTRRASLGTEIVYVSLIRDVSFRSEVDRDLRIALQALDSAFDSVIVHRPDGELVYCNVAAAANLGFTVEELRARGKWGWATGSSPEMRQQRLEEVRRTGTSSFIAHALTKDGDDVYNEVNSQWFETPDGSLIVSVSRNVTEKVRAQEMLRHLAFHDPLTGLANRALLDDRLAVAMANAKRFGDLLGLVYLDIDDFKPINDTYGHDFGDRVLVLVAQRLAGAVRGQDTVARLGGDEFVVVLPRLRDPDDVERAAEKLAAEITQPLDIDGVRVQLTASFGCALSDHDEDDTRSLVMKADIAMYEAKRAGRGSWHTFDGSRP